MSDKEINKHAFGFGDGSEPILQPLQRIIEEDVEHFRRTLNHPEPLKPYAFGDGSGLRARVYEVTEGRRAAPFRDIPTGAPFYDAGGNEWRKADENWAVRVDDGASMPLLADAIFEVIAPHTQEEE